LEKYSVGLGLELMVGKKETEIAARLQFHFMCAFCPPYCPVYVVCGRHFLASDLPSDHANEVTAAHSLATRQ
jgi:hypothetical protein